MRLPSLSKNATVSEHERTTHMIIGLDLDGVSAEYIDGLRQSIARERGYTPEQVAEFLPPVTDYGFSNWDNLGEDFVKFHTDAVERGLYAGIPSIQGASETLWKLSDEGHHIRVITKRFVKNGQHGKVVADTAAWLDAVNIPYRDLAFLGKKTDLYADIYIDDAPSNITAFQEAGANYIIFDAPYNQGLPGWRVQNWEEVYDWFQVDQTLKEVMKDGGRLVHK